MGGAARPLHDPGNHRSIERGSNPHAARCSKLRRPAKPAGERHVDAGLTPQPGTRSQGRGEGRRNADELSQLPAHLAEVELRIEVLHEIENVALGRALRVPTAAAI